MRTPALLAVAAAAGLAACGSTSTSNSGSQSGSSSTPAPATTPTAVATPPASLTPIASHTSCTGHRFGTALAPLNPPSNLHVYAAAPPMQIDQARLYAATITTGRGTMVLCLDPKLAPLTVNNVVALARNHFYDGLLFHRVVRGFVIQGGDPQGNGSGGPGYSFKDEPVKGDYTDGCVAMANSGPDTNGSQFFICIADDTRLPKSYNLFGAVDRGLEVAHATQVGDVMTTVTVAAQAD
ncbi:MAG TPA: peptidylprolyl isomerase [Candidatus Dormibacteraeota bacterium]|nr:peptidylprolyl isomerase [Candidatus Dormibacteraeota bacterium]